MNPLTELPLIFLTPSRLACFRIVDSLQPSLVAASATVHTEETNLLCTSVVIRLAVIINLPRLAASLVVFARGCRLHVSDSIVTRLECQIANQARLTRISEIAVFAGKHAGKFSNWEC
jgi:hypothetical protein